MNKKRKICPCCDADGCTLVTHSPVAGCWEVYGCPQCFFTWRTTEPDTITDGRKYDPRFKLDAEKISRYNIVPTIPPLLKE